MTDRFGAVKLSTIRRDFDRLREAVRVCGDAKVEAAWLNCERWLPWIEAANVDREREGR